ncbi:hypothetical protein CN193_31380, partial [Sinorhizobium meliloti]
MDDNVFSAALVTVRSLAEVDRLLDRVKSSAARVYDWVAAFEGDPLQMLRHMKFDQVGLHPLAHYPLNIVEQINQTWTFSVALLAARQLLLLHPEARGFHLAPGAHASQPLDIMSEVEGIVGAETFAAVTPRNNNKLAKDIAKLSARSERHRYIFFMSPEFPGSARLPRLERDGIQ